MKFKPQATDLQLSQQQQPSSDLGELDEICSGKARLLTVPQTLVHFRQVQDCHVRL